MVDLVANSTALLSLYGTLNLGLDEKIAYDHQVRVLCALLILPSNPISEMSATTTGSRADISTTKIFIDGQAGTTGLDMRERLMKLPRFELLEIEDAERKNNARRKELIDAADIAVLCLPDEAAIEAVELARDSTTRILDASTAHRVSANWAYGLPELSAANRAQVTEAKLVSNPGCYPQGVILGIAPLVNAGWLDSAAALSVHALSGYSGGGTKLIQRIEQMSPAERPSWSARPYALNLQHKHMPEMQLYSGLMTAPLFAPTVGNYYKGMIVSTALPGDQLSDNFGKKTAEDVSALLTETYENEPFIKILSLDEAAPDGFLDPTACIDTNRLEFIVTGNSDQVLITARYDNLGKGAGGAALQNLNLMSGCTETDGLAA